MVDTFCGAVGRMDAAELSHGAKFATPCTSIAAVASESDEQAGAAAAASKVGGRKFVACGDCPVAFAALAASMDVES